MADHRAVDVGYSRANRRVLVWRSGVPGCRRRTALTTDRRATPGRWRTQERLLELGVLADTLGYDHYWLTGITSSTKAMRCCPTPSCSARFWPSGRKTSNQGALFHIIPNWHPLRFAEDLPPEPLPRPGRHGHWPWDCARETQPLSYNRVSIGSFENPDSARPIASIARSWTSRCRSFTWR